MWFSTKMASGDSDRIEVMESVKKLDTGGGPSGSDDDGTVSVNLIITFLCVNLIV